MFWQRNIGEEYVLRQLQVQETSTDGWKEIIYFVLNKKIDLTMQTKLELEWKTAS